MARFAALLRGVNVGPTTRVPMAELRELLESMGATDVRTLLNSGNAVFQLHASPKSIDAMLAEAISERFGFRVEVVTRTRGQLESVLDHDPLGHLADDDSKYVIAFMPGRPRAAAIKPLLEADYPNGEQVALKGRELWVWTPKGVAESRALKELPRTGAIDHYTARNVRTVRKILEIL